MPHETALIATIAAGLGLAFIFGMLAVRLKLPPLVGYLVAGIAVGPHTPGLVADIALASQLAEIGVILLMFGVGMHFSFRDLLAVRRIAVPGAIAQITAATLLGAFMAHLWGMAWGPGLVFGLSLSVASTVVLLRALEGRGDLDSVNGRIAVGWLIVEDLVTVIALVMLPAFAGALGAAPDAAAEAAHATHGAGGSVWSGLAMTLLKVALFVVLMLVVGTRIIPWMLDRVARTGSRELFTLSVLAASLGIAFGAATLFGVSLALGAFFAGVVINESDLSHQAAADALPFQDAFAVLFFVSVGMLFDPRILVEQPLTVLATVFIIMFGKSIAAFAIVILFRHPLHTALTVSAALAQIGEFSFILAGLGVSLGVLPQDAYSLVLAGALITITLNPLAFAAIGPVENWLRRRDRIIDALERTPPDLADLPAELQQDLMHDHVVIVGFGRVGSTIGRALERVQQPYITIEQNREYLHTLRDQGVNAVYGDASRTGVLESAQISRASTLVIASPDPYQSRRIIELARATNPDIHIVVRTHSEAEQQHLLSLGVERAVMGERELALGMARYTLRTLGMDVDSTDDIMHEIRGRTTTMHTIVTHQPQS